MELVEVSYKGTVNQTPDLSQKDNNLVVSSLINSSFGEANDYIELYIYGENGQLLEVDYDASDYYPWINNNPQNNTYSSLTLDPEKDARNRGYDRGFVNLQYNFYKTLFNSAYRNYYWIKEISTSRTEIKLSSQVISDSSIISGFNSYRAYIGTKNYFPIFYLNFGNNQLVVANNVAYTEDENGSYLLVKLYEPLPTEFDVKSELWIIDKVAESVSYNVNIQLESVEEISFSSLKGPNYNVRVNTKNSQTTPYYNYDTLIASPVTSSFQKLMSWYQDRAVSINLDFSDFKNFVHFSSAVQRVNNFVYKLGLIEQANANIAQKTAISSGSSSVVSSSISVEQKIIDNIVKNFDVYEYFLYFESSSWSWPKINSTQPYTLYSVTSSQATNFVGSVNTVPTPTTASLLFSASYYDSTNKDLFHNSIPQYLLDDPSNEPFVTFLDMIGQHFDNIWVYYKDVTNRFNATNNPNTGISMDLVADALKGLGMSLYTNTNVSDNLYYTLFGINTDGSLLPPTGSELITNYVTSSIATLPAETIQDEIYKRLYHNIPYLYKTKGTKESIRALISIYGIPEEILSVKEFGGNYTGSLDGVIDLDSSELKVAIATGSAGIVTGSLTISSSLLSPYNTIQYYEGNTRLNSANLEIGFSPSDKVNNEITSSLGVFNIDQLVGSPSYMYSSSYQPLVSASNAYFSSYTQKNSVWEYIRLLKFYNNSLFKLIKDFVPARANVSTGIIVKSHMLERNKYARHEPQLTFNDYSQSIDMLEVSADNGGSISGSTAWNSFLVTPLGLASYSSSQNQELYTGQFSGSEIQVTDGQALEQGDYISHITGAIDTYNYGAIYQNITASVKSQFQLDLDYTSNQIKPVNYGAVTYSISQSKIDSYATYTNPNNPFAQVQDFNQNSEGFVVSRYRGEEVSSAQYNVYTPGDVSYGKTAVIDKIKYQYAYLVDIYSGSMFLPMRSNAQIKYVIDNDENVLDLNKENKNIFTVQNVFKSQENCNVSLFEYPQSNPYIQQLAKNPTITIYEGGYRYLPILHNLSGSQTNQIFDIDSYISNTITVDAYNSGVSPDADYLFPQNWNVYWVAKEIVQVINDTSNYAFYVSASYVGGGSNPPVQVVLTVDAYLDVNASPYPTCTTTPQQVTINIPASTGKGVSRGYGVVYDYAYQAGNGSSVYGGTHWPTGVPNCDLSISNISAGSSGGGSTTSYYEFFTTYFTSSMSCVYYLSQSNELVFNCSMSYYYNRNIVYRSTSDPAWSSGILDPVILPFTLQTGDKVSLYNSQSFGWSEVSEYTVKSVRQTGSFNTVTSSALLVQLDRPVNLALFTSGSLVPTESVTGAQYKACRYVVWKHVPDETNIMLRYDPKDSSIVENGLLFPQYIGEGVKEASGNVIKSLKQQNLI